MELEINGNVLSGKNGHEALIDVLLEIELRLTQARLAAGIGRKKDRTGFLLGELDRIQSFARAALDLAEKP